ncbi:uncharacterized protein J3D65DRAFT_626332 [Phyllosticta citribraziliensis]|uniref:Uncharacterized protein n=1 Tax=Phyllosticta citribraziliensis TaxID=989973 RepID=A0ABR1LP88_9PEZI
MLVGKLATPEDNPERIPDGSAIVVGTARLPGKKDENGFDCVSRLLMGAIADERPERAAVGLVKAWLARELSAEGLTTCEAKLFIGAIAEGKFVRTFKFVEAWESKLLRGPAADESARAELRAPVGMDTTLEGTETTLDGSSEVSPARGLLDAKDPSGLPVGKADVTARGLLAKFVTDARGSEVGSGTLLKRPEFVARALDKALFRTRIAL